MKRPSGRRRLMERQENRAGLALVSPTLAVVVLVVLLPFCASVLFAFEKLRLIDIPNLSLANLELSFDNFTKVFASAGFWEAVRVTFAYAICTTVGAIAVGLGVSLALRHPFRGRGVVRGLVLVPYVLPVVAAAMLWKTMLNTQYGPVNAFGMEFLGWKEPISFLSTTSQTFAGIPVPVTLIVVICFEIWKTFPLTYLFITARLQAVQTDVEEAALIDGAAPTQSFRYVILPQLAGVIGLLAVLRFIWSFQSFNDIYLLTGGGGGTQVLAVRVYDELMVKQNIGTASALGMVMTAVLLIFLVIYVRANRVESRR